MSDPWKIVHFSRCTPLDPDFIWAKFDVEVNHGNSFRNVELRQEASLFFLAKFEATPQLKAQVLTAALSKLGDQPD